jgi:hypothetical protein
MDLSRAVPGDEELKLGTINLSGKSAVTLRPDRIEYPFSPYLELFLGKKGGQDFDIKRPLEGTDRPPPVKIELDAVVNAKIDETF